MRKNISEDFEDKVVIEFDESLQEYNAYQESEYIVFKREKTLNLLDGRIIRDKF